MLDFYARNSGRILLAGVGMVLHLYVISACGFLTQSPQSAKQLREQTEQVEPVDEVVRVADLKERACELAAVVDTGEESHEEFANWIVRQPTDDSSYFVNALRIYGAFHLSSVDVEPPLDAPHRAIRNDALQLLRIRCGQELNHGTEANYPLGCILWERQSVGALGAFQFRESFTKRLGDEAFWDDYTTELARAYFIFDSMHFINDFSDHTLDWEFRAVSAMIAEICFAPDAGPLDDEQPTEEDIEDVDTEDSQS